MRPLALPALALLFLLPLGCGDDEAGPPRAGGGSRYDAEGNAIVPVPAYEGRRPNLVVILIDTLRADALDTGRMPYVTSLAAKGVSFPDATAPSPWTVPSITSFLTGLLPSGHGCDQPLKGPRLLGAVTTFAEVLRQAYGYETAAYTAGPWISDKESVLQGFTRGGHPFALQGTTKILERFVAQRDKDKPFFLFLHSYEAHDPYGEGNHPWPQRPVGTGRQSGLDLETVTEPWQITKHVMTSWDERVDLYNLHGTELSRKVVRYVHAGFMENPRPDLADELRTAYWKGVRWVDGLVEASVEQLGAWGMLEDTVLVVTSDHGEAFGEHGILAHGRQMYDEQVRIPLVMTGPAPFDGGRVIAGGVGLIDVLPTFLEHAGCAPLDGVQGRSFLARLTSDRPGRPVFSEEILNRDNTGLDTQQVLTSVRSKRWKYIITFDELKGTVMEEAYDLEADPLEQNDLSKGLGRIEGLTFDLAFCEAIEMARDRIWGAAAAGNRLYASPYGAGRAMVTSDRPAACAVK